MEEDEELKKLEEELAKITKMDVSGSGYPEPISKDSIFRFFREILQSNDSRKTGNLLESELGRSKLGVRHYFEIAAYAEAEGLSLVSQYLADKAEIILSTSMSRKGFLAKLFVTQIKQEKKIKEPTPEKKKWFSNKQPGAEE